MADVVITTDNIAATHGFAVTVVKKDINTIYSFFTDKSLKDVVYRKSIDGGLTWGADVTMLFGIDQEFTLHSVWYDRWTPGDLGTKIHVLGQNFNSVGGRQFEYVNLETANDLNSGIVTILNYSALGVSGVGNTITKAKNGYLYVHTDGPFANRFFLRSVNGGLSWGLRTVVPIGWAQPSAFYPAGWRDDDADIAAITHTSGTGELRLREYDDSLDTWSSAVIVAALGFTGSFTDRGSAVRLSDEHLIVVGLDIVSTPLFSDVKMRVWDVNGVASITELTPIVIDAEAGTIPSVFIDANDDIYVAWTIGAGGAHTQAEFVKSTDGGITWSAPTNINSIAYTDLRWLSESPAMPDGGLYAPVFLDLIADPSILRINPDTVPSVTAVLTGTAIPSLLEQDVRDGGKTIIITINRVWDATIGADNPLTQALIDGLDSDKSEGSGWDAVVKPGLTFNDVARTSDTVVTITLPAFPSFDLAIENETIIMTVLSTTHS